MTISAKVIADSTSAAGKRITTLQLRYPKFIHGEFMTHRVFSRNASSSRAIPVERLVKDVVEDPVYPSFWGKNQAGMQAAEEHDEWIKFSEESRLGSMNRYVAWEEARNRAVEMARAFAAAGYHKQIVNRLLEPFCHINVVVTATEWSNFFVLRCHPAAQPEMRELAEKMRDAMAANRPQVLKPGEWHLPYVTEVDLNVIIESYYDRSLPKPQINTEWDRLHGVAIKISVARCARVSYLTQEGEPPTIEKDVELYDRLVGATPLHASPAEHQATPDEHEDYYGLVDKRLWKKPELHGNFVGFIQYRKTLPGECQ